MRSISTQPSSIIPENNINSVNHSSADSNDGRSSSSRLGGIATKSGPNGSEDHYVHKTGVNGLLYEIMENAQKLSTFVTRNSDEANASLAKTSAQLISTNQLELVTVATTQKTDDINAASAQELATEDGAYGKESSAFAGGAFGGAATFVSLGARLNPSLSSAFTSLGQAGSNLSSGSGDNATGVQQDKSQVDSADGAFAGQMYTVTESQNQNNMSEMEKALTADSGSTSSVQQGAFAAENAASSTIVP